MKRDAAVAAFLAALSILVYYPLTVQGKVLASFDSLVYFYPNAQYLAERLRAGQLPLWNPYLFGGVPFLANSQVGVFYPPSWLYLLGQVSVVSAWLLVGHVWWLALGGYLLGRASLGLSRPAATFAAVGLAYGGWVTGMGGHLNQVEALAWAPLAILAVERGVATARWRTAALAAVPLTLAAFAGHTQMLYMTMVVALAAGAGRLIQRWWGWWPPVPTALGRPAGPAKPPPGATGSAVGGTGSLSSEASGAVQTPSEIGSVASWPALAADVGRLGIGVVLTAMLAAIQLLPTLELTHQSIRATGLAFKDAAAFSFPPTDALTMLLPNVTPVIPSTEWLGWVGVTTVALALYGLWRRPTAEAWALAGLAVVGLLLAVGQFTPLYQLAFVLVPGVRLFRVPARWLMLWSLGAPLLAGGGLDAALHYSRAEGTGGGAWGARSGPAVGDSSLSPALPAADGGALSALPTGEGGGERLWFPPVHGGTEGGAFRSRTTAAPGTGTPPPPALPVDGEGNRGDGRPTPPPAPPRRGEEGRSLPPSGGKGQGGMPPAPERPGAERPPWLTALGGLALLAALAILAEVYRYRHYVARPNLATLGLWAGTLVLLAALFRLRRRWPALVAAGAIALLTVELTVASLALPMHDAVWPDAVDGSRLTVDDLLAMMPVAATRDRVLGIGDNTYDPGDLAELRAMLGNTLGPEANAEYITALKHVEGLTPNLPMRFDLSTIDGYDGGVLPLARYADLKQLFPVQGRVVDDGRLRLQLKSVPNPVLLGWLNVRYVIQDRLRDQWVDGVYYDLGVTQPLTPRAPLTLTTQPPVPTTTIGVALTGIGMPLPSGTLLLRAGGRSLPVAVSPGGAAVRIHTDTDAQEVWLFQATLPRPAVLSAVSLAWQGTGSVALRALSLSDSRTGASQSIPVSPDYRLVALGDMKIYEDRAVLPQAFLTDGLTVLPNLPDVVSTLRDPTWPPQQAAVAAGSDVARGLAFQASGDPGQTRLLVNQPERVVVQTQASGQRVLVLTDAAYPGWQATIDGHSAPILTVDVMFRGVVVPPGQHQVAFTYQPASVRLGLAVSLLGLAGLIAVLIVGRDRAASAPG